MNRVLERTKITDRFKVAGDSDSLEEASERLSHSSTEITKRVYRRKPVKVLPLERKIA